MVCIHCGSSTRVINSRLQKQSNQIWRRRLCNNCQAIFTTEEIADYSKSWVVMSQNKEISPFFRDKLFISIYNSCMHRDNGVVDASNLTSTVIKNLAKNIESGAVSTNTIKHVTQVALNRFDKTAAVHYLAFHK